MHEAHERIESARRDGDTLLDLSGLRLRELSPTLRELAQLQTLYLGDNHLAEIPPWLAELTGLTGLELCGNRLVSLPDLGALQALTTLDLSENRLAAVPGWIGGMAGLEQLRLDGNRIADLPEAMAGLTRLKRLNLIDNDLQGLPDWFAGLRSLEELFIGACPLREFPRFLGSLTGLRNLFVYGSDPIELPAQWDALTGLDSLTLGDCGLEEVPHWIRGLTGLTFLGLGGNRLRRLPDWLVDLPSLSHLLLEQNELTELPARMGGMQGLSMLDLDGNPLSGPPQWLSGLTGLTHLGLSGIPLAEPPAWLGRLTALEHLDLHGCGMTRLPDSLANLTRLETLDIGGNGLVSLPEWLGGLGGLRRLRLNSNPIAALPDSLARLTGLTHLNLADCRLARVPDWLAGMSRLATLQLERNELTRLPDFVGELRSLEMLQLSGNPLGALPDWLGNLDRLDTLSASGCGLTGLPACLGELTELEYLYLADNRLTAVPDLLGDLVGLKHLSLSKNGLAELPGWLSGLSELVYLDVSGNHLTTAPECLRGHENLTELYLGDNALAEVPEWMGELPRLRELGLRGNRLTSLPFSLARPRLTHLDVSDNPLAPELAAAAKDSTEELLGFLRLLAQEGTFVHEGKLILVGEGAVGKSSLLAALRGEGFVDGRDTTHGVEVKQLRLDPIVLNAWDFGGQPVYRPTHQMFFSAPAVYLVVWKPREGPEQGFVDYWIRLIQHRASADARIHVVATHGGPLQRSAHLDVAALRERYGDMIVGFHHVDSKTGVGIEALKQAIAGTAQAIPHIGRWYPRSWQRLREALREDGRAFLTYAEFEAIARPLGITETSARSVAKNSHELGHWIHYTDAPELADLVILKADWLATAISLVLDDPATIGANGLLRHRALPKLWDNPDRARHLRYPQMVHRVFLQLMERFDISYRVTDGSDRDEPTSLVAQLVRADRPDLTAWTAYGGELEESAQVCEIVETATGLAAVPEGLMYQLIVRFHRYSLGREDYRHSRHWQHGVVLDADHHGRGLVTMERNRVLVTVRAAYPQLLLHQLTEEIREHVQSFWKGLAARVKVACGQSCVGLFDVENLVKSREEGRGEFPCHVCGRWQRIDELLLGVRRGGAQERLTEAVRAAIRPEIAQAIAAIDRRFDRLDIDAQRAMSQAEERYRDLLAAFDDAAREGPRLFTVVPVDSTLLRPGWLRQRIRLTLWCEHSRLPLHVLNRDGGPSGIYDIDVPREWLVKAGPWLNALSTVVRTFLPVSLAFLKLELSESEWSAVGEQLEFAEKAIDVAATSVGDAVGPDAGLIRTVQALLRERDPSFGGLERVRDRHRYRWVHPRFAASYRLPAPEIPCATEHTARDLGPSHGRLP